ncbi:MAG: cation:proton antiporter [Candidatus Moranbacteria bacterium]|nr:cation:proton antiporter [Candidatus Moranbacteria bacterium]
MSRVFSRGAMSLLVMISVIILSSFGVEIYEAMEHSHEHVMLVNFFVIAVLFVLSFLVFYVSRLVKLPSFVVAIFMGIAGKNLLGPVVGNNEILGVIVSLGATLILFSGGLEIPFSNFRKLIWKIFSLSFVGLFLTAFALSWAVWFLGANLGFVISIPVAVLLGAVLCSTDPAAIIPVLKSLRFKNRSVKDIVISESAVTDVVGTLMTIVFLSIAVSGTVSGGINQWYQSIFNIDSAIILVKQLVFGVAAGLAGYIFLEALLRVKRFYGREFEADAAFFLSVPIIIFTLALFAGGSGYLAAFVAGLIFHITEHLNETEVFFNSLVDGFLKPTIFILLGALVDLGSLIEYAPIGILVALIFMLVIRPFSVFMSLGAFKYFGKDDLSWNDLLFISFVRETGAIPAVLMLTIVSLGLGDISGLVEIGMWVILLTLVIEPMLTPFVARKLGVAEIIQNERPTILSDKASVMLVTRGKSVLKRLPFVIEWAKRHNVEEISVMLCLENNYTPEYEKEIEEELEKVFEATKKELREQGLPEIEFSFLSKKGFLHDNIEEIAKMDNRISTIFVGKKMLDYHLGEIKDLGIPFYFMD